ncbi:ABC transporter substrate-binding protein [Kozakia baliensis]|uniref:ABC transporter substrate-binding protein n=1 Tax=Kozakia baliensis TaxID=153496 RepID=UPI000879FCDA|nr:ABC transporter substrate-binding protein [Kozakia baliensis]AOX19599.1 hypothetical protein A0U90_04095 [Kozakia baliensis]
MSVLKRRGLVLGGGVALAAALIETRHFLHPQRHVTTDGKIRHVRLAWPEAAYDPIYDLCRKDLFSRFSLDVELADTSSGNMAIDAVRSGRADAAVAPILDWIPALYTSRPDQIPAKLVSSVNGGSYRLLVRRSLHLHKVSDLAGKRVGVRDMEGADRRFISIKLRRRGMHPTDSVNWIAMPNDDMAGALRTGEIDAVAVHDPAGWQILQETKGLTWNMIDSMTGAERERVDLALGIASGRLRDDPGLTSSLILALRAAAKSFPAKRAELAKQMQEDDNAPSDPRGMLDRQIGGHVVIGHDLRVQIEQYIDELKLIGIMRDSDNTTQIAHMLSA